MRKSVFGIGLIAGPVLFVIQALLTPPLSTDSGEVLENYAASSNLDLLALLAALSMLGMIAAFLGLRSLAGEDNLSMVAGGLAVAGIATQPIWIGVDTATSAISAAGTGAAQVALVDALNDSTGVMVAMLGSIVYVVGVVLLAVALARSKAVATPFAALIGLFPILMVAGFGSSMNSLLIAGGVAGVLGMAPIGFKLLGGGEQAAAATAPAG